MEGYNEQPSEGLVAPAIIKQEIPPGLPQPITIATGDVMMTSSTSGVEVLRPVPAPVRGVSAMNSQMAPMNADSGYPGKTGAT